MGERIEIVDRPFEPDTTRKKKLRSPAETVQLAKEHAGKAVVHSKGHTTENAARTAVKRIHSGQYLWAEWAGKIHAYVIEDKGSPNHYAVAVTWTGGEEAPGKK